MGTTYFQTRTLEFIPDLLSLHGINPQRYPHLLASVAQGNADARYDILFAFPQQTIRGESFLQQLDTEFSQHNIDQVQTDLPFYGGWFLYLGYELAEEIEPSLNLVHTPGDIPVAFATRFPVAIIHDHLKQQTTLVCENDFSDCFDSLLEDITASSHANNNLQQEFVINNLVEEDSQTYLDQVEQIKNYIVEGDVFQVNLSRQWQCNISASVSHASVFRSLSQSNPGPYNALVTMGDNAIISSSPERLIEVRGNKIQTRPIAGTRPRSDDDSVDESLSEELLAHKKERAEHIMLIDLERNDLGRICEPGSVEVNELMTLESYKHVHHIVSNVRGRLKPGVTPGQIIKAVFPGGTITGCPKVRCMEILAELEQAERGPYTGSLGYLNRDGSMDLNILIRTLVRRGQEITFRAGGGIVADSIPQHELAETRAKAKGLILALQTS
ncbi:MAG: aminodeoxychorismate synthase component I [Gammaproteobacteria bacterium]|nr:aminodeoxychorismate synthase component I [Gammaproteobacteria bacterium]